MQPQLKACPKCQTAAPLNASQCAGCGHAFRTQFPPTDQTQVITAVKPPPQALAPIALPAAAISSGANRRRITYAITFLAAVGLVLAFWFAWSRIAPLPFLGTWVSRSGGSTLGFIFYQNGTGEKFFDLAGADTDTTQPSGQRSFRWTRDGNFLLLKYNGDRTPLKSPIPGTEAEVTPVAWSVSEAGNVLTLQHDNFTMSFYREGKPH